MASIFSASPSFNDTFTSNGTTWQWNGEAWTVVASDGQTFTNVITSPSSQTITADSPTDTLTIAAGTNISVSGNSSNDTLTISSTIDTQNLINTASAAAYTSACGYTNFIVDGLDTLDIEENTNLYFTNQRAIDATSSLITSASANALSQANTYSNSASANALAQANSYTNSASASLVAYTNSASASLVAYTDQEVSALQLFSNISTSPSTQLITGDSNSDTLTFISGENITISADSSTDSITINSTGNYNNVDSISTPDYIQFDTTANTTPVTGLLGWDSVEGTLNLGLSSGKHIHVGEESVYRVRNSTGSTIQKGTALYASGVQPSGRIEVSPYVADGSVREVRFMGLATESITNGVNGFVQHFGYVTGLDTRGTSSTAISVGDETWAAGDLLYVHPTVPGKLTNVKPQHEIVVAILIIRHQTTGILFVRPTSGGHIEDIHDIKISGVANEDILLYNSASSIWVNSPKQNIITTASAAAYASASAYTDSEINALTTTDIEEGTNLYFTNERAVNAGSATYILQTNQQGIINSASAAAVTAVIDGAPGALDTLNELAAALGDDQNFATSVTNSLSGKLDISTASTTYLTQAAYASASPNFATDAELASAIVTASAAAVAYADGLTTTDVAEGTNLYYTTARGQQTASTMFVHGNHTNVSAQYVSGEIRLTSSAAGGGGATVAYQTTQPDTSALDAGSLWIDSDQDAISGLLPATFTRWVKVLSASATTISGLDDNVLSLLYTPGYEKVFINGTLLVRGSDYTASTGNTVVLTVAAETTDVIEIHSYESFQIADTYTQAAADAKFFPINESRVDRWTKTYSASATTINGTDDYSESLLYTSGLESLFINGVLVDPSEYTRTSASVITPDEAILFGDVVDIISPKAFDVANTYTIGQIDAKYNNRTRWTKTYSASATVISGVDDNANTLSYTSGYEEVYLNGILLTPITDYARTSASVITLGVAVVTNDIIDVVNIQPFNVADVYTEAESDAKYLTQVSASTTYAPLAAGGLVLLNTTTIGSTVSSIIISNCFNTSYDSYKIIVDFANTTTSSSGNLNVRLRTGSTSASANYAMKGWYATPSGLLHESGSSTEFTSLWYGVSNPGYSFSTMEFISPFLAKPTKFVNHMVGFYANTSQYSYGVTGYHTPSTSYESLEFVVTSGTITGGTIRVYGYRN